MWLVMRNWENGQDCCLGVFDQEEKLISKLMKYMLDNNLTHWVRSEDDRDNRAYSNSFGDFIAWYKVPHNTLKGGF